MDYDLIHPSIHPTACWLISVLGKHRTQVDYSVCVYVVVFFFNQTSSEDGKQEKKNDQPPQAKKPKVKTKTVDLPIENSLQWQLANDMLNLFVENEVMQVYTVTRPYIFCGLSVVVGRVLT